MNSTLNYVISRQINQLLSGPSYVRWLVLLILATALSLILINQFIIGIRDSSKQLDEQFSEIDSQLARYEQQRDKINHDYERLMNSTRLIAELKEQFSNANSEDVESWLIHAAMNNDLQPSQIHINTQLTDEQGEFFRVIFKMSGTYQNIQTYLVKIMRSDYFLIWEKLIFDVFESNQLSLTISLKQYVEINDEDSVSG